MIPRRSLAPPHARRGLPLAVLLVAACGNVSSSPPSSDVALAVIPATATLAPDAAQSFQASVAGAADTAVSWTLQESTGCGSVDASGRYVAPSSPTVCHVVATSHADPTKRAAARVDVVTGGAPWRPFSDASPWNTLIPANPELEATSATLVADFASSSPYGSRLDVNLAQYSIPLYWADASTPTYTVHANVGGSGWSGSNGTNTTGSMPIPSGAAPDPAADHHLLVVNRETRTEWGCWSVTGSSTTGWSAGLCATADLSGTGVRPPITCAPSGAGCTAASPWYLAEGARACGFPLIAGLIRPEEVAAGRIEHALVVAYPHIRAGWFTPPASTGQARMGTNAISTRGIPCGGRIQFDPSVDVTTLGLSATGQIIVRALQEYGAYVGDYSGSISLYADNSPSALAAWQGVLTTSVLSGLDLSRFRVIKLGTLYDNGNGN